MNYGYGTANAVDDIMSRLETIQDSGASEANAKYTYLGANKIVTEDYMDIDVKLDYTIDGNQNPDL